MNKYKLKFAGSHEVIALSADTMEKTETHYIFKVGDEEVGSFDLKSVIACWKV